MLRILTTGFLACCFCIASACIAEETVSDGTLTVALDDTSYAAGDTAQVTVANSTAHTVLFAFICDAFIEGLVGAEWEIVFEPDCSNLRVMPTRLDAAASTVLPLQIETEKFDDNPKYWAFRVRLRFQYEDNAGYRFADSTPFRVAHQ